MEHDVRSMQPGPELDRQIDEVLFGRTFTEFPRGFCYHNGRGWREAAPYSTTWEGMGLVVEEMQRRGLDVHIDFVTFGRNKLVDCAIIRNGLEMAHLSMMPNAPHAVAMAALLALLALLALRGGEQG
ncbi:hypothetical protein QJ48_04255 [Paenibacillus sp. A3]|nr:hypothetical protein QJ48_04255 [Paenibacillus sp. A3]